MANSPRCGDYNQLLSAYLDGEITSAERSDLLQHLASCPACRATLEEYRSIGTRLRGLAPVQVPDDLTDSIYALTVDAPPKRLFPFTSRIGYPVAAIAAVLLIFIVAAFLLVDGYQRRIDPSIAGSAPSMGDVYWDINKPIKITFNKEMNHDSVEQALRIQPTTERDRLDLNWEGNTLIIGGNATLKPGASYEISFTDQARDKWGNPLEDPFTLTFAASTTQRLAEATSTAVEPEPTQTPEQPEQAVEHAATNTPVPPTATPKTDDQAFQPSPTPQNTVTPVPEEPDGAATGNGQSGQPIAPTPTTAPEAPPTPTAIPPTATPVETEEPTPVPPTQTPMPTVEPTATTEPEPTEAPATPTTEPEPTTTPDTVGVVGSFGTVYWRNDPVKARLGVPLNEAAPMSASELDFQRGKMFQRHDTGQIYVMETTGLWSIYPAPLTDQYPEFVETDETGIYEPGGVFGYLWSEDSTIVETLGLAIEDANHEYDDSLIQTFEDGTMLYSSDGFIYVLYDDNGTWELYPDPGPLSDDAGATPVPGA